MFVFFFALFNAFTMAFDNTSIAKSSPGIEECPPGKSTERVAEIKPFCSLLSALQHFENERLLIWCDEASAGHPALNISTALANAPPHEKAAVLIGPEGGFSESERTHLQSRVNCLKVSLGPRLLRADTAAISALSCYQSICGDWQN